MVQVKICGLTTLEDALFAAECGADMLGFNFYTGSKRYIDPTKAAEICDALRKLPPASRPRLIGLFVNESVGTISAITRKVGLDFAQLSGDESDSVLKELHGIGFKAIRAQNVSYAIEDATITRRSRHQAIMLRRFCLMPMSRVNTVAQDRKRVTKSRWRSRE